MALNITMLDGTRAPIPLPQEMTITSVSTGAEILLNISDQAAGSTKLKAMGNVWLTDQRFVFVALLDSLFESLTIPLPSILSTHFEQPAFSSNYYAFDIKPSGAGSGLGDLTKAELRFKNTAMFEFVALLEKTRERAIYMKRQIAQEDDSLPTYSSPADAAPSVQIVAGIAVDNPPDYAA